MRGSPIVALATAAAIVAALAGVAVHASVDSPPTVVAEIQPLSIPASYQPKHFLKIATKGADGVALVQPTQPVTLNPGLVTAPESRASVGAFTGDARTKSAAPALSETKKHESATNKHKTPAVHGSASGGHPKAHAHNQSTKPKTHAKAPKPKHSNGRHGMTLWQWILWEAKHHRHHRHH